MSCLISTWDVDQISKIYILDNISTGLYHFNETKSLCSFLDPAPRDNTQQCWTKPLVL